MAYRASTSANPNPVISLVFVEANYEALESLLRNRRRQMRNNDLRTELEYFSEDYDEEREMEPRPEPIRAATLTLRVASPRIRRQGERIALPNNIGGNLPFNGTYLSYHAQPFIPARLSIPNGSMPIHVHPYQQPTSFINGQHLSFPTQTPPGNLPMGGIPDHLPQDGYAPQTFATSNMPS
ncbi:hypothetical protein Tco_0690448 [Tanacetum coccineum]